MTSGLLRGGTKALFNELLSPLYMDANLTTRALTYDDEGTLQRGAAPTTCKARVDSATEAMRSAEGYTITDRAVYILAGSLSIEVTTDMDIEILEGDYAGKVFGIASVDRPPGASYFACRGSKRG